MKDLETKQAFVEMRAQGKSYTEIANTLHVGRSTLCEWNKALKQEVDNRRRDELESLYAAYGMQKAARIERLGKTLQRIDEVLDLTDLSAVPPEKLLEFKLKYMEALGNEYIGESSLFEFVGTDPSEILKYLGDLLNRVRSGDASKEQATRECAVLGSFLKAYEQTELKARLDTLDAVLEARK